MDGVSSEPKIVLAPLQVVYLLSPKLCLHQFAFTTSGFMDIFQVQSQVLKKREVLPILGTCVCHTQNPNLQLDHLTFGGMDCVFIPKSKMLLIFLMCLFFNTFAIVCYYFVIFCWHSLIILLFFIFFVVLGVVQVCFCSQPSLGHS